MMTEPGLRCVTGAEQNLKLFTIVPCESLSLGPVRWGSLAEAVTRAAARRGILKTTVGFTIRDE